MPSVLLTTLALALFSPLAQAASYSYNCRTAFGQDFGRLAVSDKEVVLRGKVEMRFPRKENAVAEGTVSLSSDKGDHSVEFDAKLLAGGVEVNDRYVGLYFSVTDPVLAVYAGQPKAPTNWRGKNYQGGFLYVNRDDRPWNADQEVYTYNPPLLCTR